MRTLGGRTVRYSPCRDERFVSSSGGYKSEEGTSHAARYECVELRATQR